jgi:biotin carboxyl carrier protein
MSSTYQVTIGERVLRVRLRNAGEQLFAQVDDGPEQVVELSNVRGALRLLLVGGRGTEILAAKREDGVWLNVDGHDLVAEVEDEAHARLAQVAGGRAASHARRELKAPMPGLVVKVLCQAGDEVAAGQPLVVLQAMKMENELSLSRGGTVGQVSAQAGQTVEQGQVLVVVE